MKFCIYCKWGITLITFVLTFSLPVISQTYTWTHTFGDVANDVCNDIALDESGNVYSTGFFSGTIDFDPGAGESSETYVGNTDVYILKMDNSGNHIWSRSFGGTANDQGNNITIDQNGNVYTVGTYVMTVDFDPGVGVDNKTSFGESDIFIQKLDSNGNYEWCKTIGGINPDFVYSIAIDSQGELYMTGFFSDTVDFDPGPSITNLSSFGARCFILKLDSNGDLVWAKSLDGSQSTKGFSLDIDSQDNVLITGYFEGTIDFDPGEGVSNITSAGNLDAFFLKLSSEGEYIWAKSIGSESFENCYSILTDSFDNVYAYGYFDGTVDMDPNGGVSSLTNNAPMEGFLLKLDSSGNYIWSNLIGGRPLHLGQSIAISPDNDVMITGNYNGTHDFDHGPGTDNLTSSGARDLFIQKFQSDGDHLWVKSIGGSSSDEFGMTVEVDNDGNLFCGGYYTSDNVDFDPDTGIETHSNIGGFDLFIQKYNSIDLGLNELSPTNYLTVYPNPSSHIINIKTSSEWNCYSIQFVDVTGALIHEVLTKTDESSFAVDTLPSGVYYIIATNDKGAVIRRKIVIQ